MDEIAAALAALVPGAACFAVPVALVLVVRPRRLEHTWLRALAAWVVFAAFLAGPFAGVLWWLQVLIRIAFANEDFRTWPSAFAPTVLCMVALAAVLHELFMLVIGLDADRRAEERADPSSPPTKFGPS